MTSAGPLFFFPKYPITTSYNKAAGPDAIYRSGRTRLPVARLRTSMHSGHFASMQKAHKNQPEGRINMLPEHGMATTADILFKLDGGRSMP